MALTKVPKERFKVTKFDAADFLEGEDDARAYLAIALEDSPTDGRLIAKVLGTIARARGVMAEVAATTGLSRESLYKSLSGRRDPGLTTILKVMQALGYRLEIGGNAVVSAETRSSASEPNWNLHVDPISEMAPAVLIDLDTLHFEATAPKLRNYRSAKLLSPATARDVLVGFRGNFGFAVEAQPVGAFHSPNVVEFLCTDAYWLSAEDPGSSNQLVLMQ